MKAQKPSKDSTIASQEKLDLRAAGLLARRALLVILSGNFLGRTHVIESTPTVIGRHADCDFVIDDSLLSRTHCQITVDDQGNYLLEDLDSTNATFLNSRELKKRSLLHYGDRIAVGATILRFYLEEEIRRK